MKHKPRHLRSLMRRSMRDHARAVELFKRSNALLDEAIDGGATIGETVKLNDGRHAIIMDNFAGRNQVFRAKGFSRYEIKEVKEVDNNG